jgi:hypothetical protein
MTVARSFATAVTFTVIAVGAASPACADPVFSGHYNVIDTSSGGVAITFTYDVTPCGDGCVEISTEGGAPLTAHLINGQWQWDETDNPMVCDDGTRIPAASDSHNAIDATTLRGTSLVTWKKAGCGENNVGKTFTHTLVLTKS